jgi:hypothetical protein
MERREVADLNRVLGWGTKWDSTSYFVFGGIEVAFGAWFWQKCEISG